MIDSSTIGSSISGSSMIGSSMTGSSINGSSIIGSSTTGSSINGSSTIGSSTTGSSSIGSSGCTFSITGGCTGCCMITCGWEDVMEFTAWRISFLIFNSNSFMEELNSCCLKITSCRRCSIFWFWPSNNFSLLFCSVLSKLTIFSNNLSLEFISASAFSLLLLILIFANAFCAVNNSSVGSWRFFSI